MLNRTVLYRHIALLLALTMLFALAGCGASDSEGSDPAGSDSAGYTQISQEEAIAMMEENSGYLIVDVRTQEEFDSGHIPDAICIPNEEIGDATPAQLTDPEQMLFIYCRSGRRSKEAAQKLADLGYTNVYEIGGINTWPGEVVTGEQAKEQGKDRTGEQAKEQGKDRTGDPAKEQTVKQNKDAAKTGGGNSEDLLLLEVNGETLEAELEDNAAADALKALIGEDGLTLELEEYGGFEKVGPLPESLPAEDEQISTSAGDLVLYQGNQISLFYGENSWSYTKLGHVNGADTEKLHKLLGDGDVTVTFKLHD